MTITAMWLLVCVYLIEALEWASGYGPSPWLRVIPHDSCVRANRMRERTKKGWALTWLVEKRLPAVYPLHTLIHPTPWCWFLYILETTVLCPSSCFTSGGEGNKASGLMSLPSDTTIWSEADMEHMACVVCGPVLGLNPLTKTIHLAIHSSSPLC